MNLEEEAIYLTESAYKAGNSALIYSTGKDSGVCLHIVREVLKLPMRIIDIDTMLNPPEMATLRKVVEKRYKFKCEVYESKVNHSIKFGSPECCMEHKTKQFVSFIRDNNIRQAICGCRRSEEPIRAKEHFISYRTSEGKWLEELQEPEYFGKVSINPEKFCRVFPLSNWTELDVWKYIKKKKIPVCSLYFSRGGKRFRSLGCSPCTFPVVSRARTIDGIIRELEGTDISERNGRSIDSNEKNAMEKKRRNGYY